ncbi:MAG: ABC transporter substrate-binding protein [Flavobacteriaceae bacterium]
MTSLHDGGRGLTRRTVLGACAGLAMPSLARAAGAARVAVVHPVTGPFSAAGALARAGARLGWRMAGADAGAVDLVEVDLGPDPEAVPAVVEALAGEGVSALVGGLTSPHALAVAVGARSSGLPFMVDLAGSDAFLGSGFPRVFRFAPGFDRMLLQAVVSLAAINTEAGDPSKSVLIVREPRGFAGTVALRVADRFDQAGFELLPMVDYRSAAGAGEVAETVRNQAPDVLVPLAARELLAPLLAAVAREGVPLKAIVTLLALSDMEENFSDLPGFELVIDLNHGFNTRSDDGKRFLEAVSAAGLPLRPEVFVAANAMRCLCDGMRRARSADPGEIAAAIARSSFAEAAMPYEATAFRDGENLGAHGALMQIQNGRPALVSPQRFQASEIVYPRPV